MKRFVFITGGVVSSLGKGLAAAALGSLLQLRGYRVRLRKLDPYLNVDPGTMSPYQHGEVFVTDDGAETDLDLGHYERFTGVPARASDTVSAGRIYWTVLTRERHGDYLGGTVQVIPHVTNAIKEFIENDTEAADIVLCEIGGTVGDIEGLPFFEAIRQFALEHEPQQCCFIHVTLVPWISSAPGAEDQADPALGGGVARDRHPARHPALPRRPADPGGGPAQDRAAVLGPAGGGDPGPGLRLDLRGPDQLPRGGAGPAAADGAGPAGRAGARPRLLAAGGQPGAPAGRRGVGRGGRQVHGPVRRLQVAQRGAGARRHRQQRAREPAMDRRRGVRAFRPERPAARDERGPGTRRDSASAASKARSRP